MQYEYELMSEVIFFFILKRGLLKNFFFFISPVAEITTLLITMNSLLLIILSFSKSIVRTELLNKKNSCSLLKIIFFRQ